MNYDYKCHIIASAVLLTMNCAIQSSAYAKGEQATNTLVKESQLNLSPLRRNSIESNPYGSDFDYAKAFQTLNLEEVKKDIQAVLTDSQDWWPADFGNYGPFFIRMAWHGAGTYRTWDGRGGAGGAQQRFEPLNSWPDNANLDKARRLLWPVKKKYGQKLSWGDLMVLTGNVALESMGFKTLGFAGGRTDDWVPDPVYWGSNVKPMANNRNKLGQLEKPLAATQMGLIYVNPEGPNGIPDPLAAANDIREAFARMAMNDEETVALIVGGHSFGKTHGAASPEKCIGAAPADDAIEKQGLGWSNKCGSGKGADTITSGLEGSWISTPVNFSTQFLENLFAHEWVKTKSPAGAIQWKPKDAANIVPDAHIPGKMHPLMMLTTDLSLKFDPSYRKISQRFHDNPEEFKLAFARAWFKLTHRDMGPQAHYLGNEIPKETQIWQDPIPIADYQPVNDSDLDELKSKILNAGLTTSELVKTAWASAASFRATDKRGGVNGARIRLLPQKKWPVNDPVELEKVLAALTNIQDQFNKDDHDDRKISMADLIVLAGNTAIEDSAKKAGMELKLPFMPGRTDASQEQTDINSFAVLEPLADGFRNYLAKDVGKSITQALVDRASMLSLTVPEMTVLVGGLRSLDANHGHKILGVLTNRPGILSNDFFVNLLDMSTQWKETATKGVYAGYDHKTAELKWTASSVDLIFGSNTELRAIAEVYASDDAKEKFVNDFAKAWTKVMNLDRFDSKRM